MKKILFLLSLTLSSVLFASHEQIPDIIEKLTKIRANGAYINPDAKVFITLDINSLKEDGINYARCKYEKSYLDLNLSLEETTSEVMNVKFEAMQNAYDDLIIKISRDTKTLEVGFDKSFDMKKFILHSQALREDGVMYKTYYDSSMQLKACHIENSLQNRDACKQNRKDYLIERINSEIESCDQAFLLFACNLKYRQVFNHFCRQNLIDPSNPLPLDTENYFKSLDNDCNMQSTKPPKKRAKHS